MTPDPELQFWLLVWLLAATFILARHWRTGRGAGLVFTYVLSFGAIHWMAAALYVLPWYGSAAIDYTVIGLRVSAIAMSAFAVGGELGSVLFERFGPRVPQASGRRLMSPRIVNVYLVGGLVFYGSVYPLLAGLPTVSALAATSFSLIVLGLALKSWNAWQTERRLLVWLWLLVSSGFPLMTLIGQGFLSFGFAAMVIVATFVAGFYRPRWQVVLAGLLVGYMGLSVYVTYMRDRRDIRAVVWGGDAVSSRVDILMDTFQAMEWFDPTRLEHLTRVDERLNQNALVGAAVDGIQSEAVPLAMGGTIIDAAIALVPRALWPSKPVTAGSGNIVSDYTGLTFAEGTSVGVGHVMEWYINFALPGVLLGFVLLGGVTVFVDRAAAAWLHYGDVGRFSLWYLPGMSLLNVGGSFVEMTATAAAAWAIVWTLRRVLGQREMAPDVFTAPVGEEPHS